MAVPFWRARANAGQVVLAQGPSATGAPVYADAVQSSAGSWEVFSVNGRALPGVVKLVKAPAIALHEVASKAKDKDAQVRTVRGLKSAPFVVRVMPLTEKDWADWQDMLPILLPVTRPDGRGEVRIVGHPMVQAQGITHAFVSQIDPTQIPEGGSPAAFDIHWQSWWPNMQVGSHKKVDKNLKDPTHTQTPTIDTAQSVPNVPQLSQLQRPSPARAR